VTTILLGLACLLLAACTPPRAPTAAIREVGSGATVALRAVTLVDVTNGSLRSNQTVLITGNRITAVGPTDEVRVPGNANLVDGTGGFLIPGLWDMHVHSVANVTWDIEVGSISNAEWHFPLFLAYGVTGVRNMNDATADPTLELTRSVRRRLAERDLPGPRLLASGPSVDGDPPLTSNPLVVRTAAEGRAAVDALADHSADFIKVYTNLSREAYFAIMARARQRGIPVDGHVPFRVLPAEAADAGQRTFEHLLAMALGCSTAADSERTEFASVLSDSSRSAVVERSPLELFRHELRLYETRNPAACTATIEAYSRNGVAEAPSLVGYHHVVNAQEILSDARTRQLVPAAIRGNWEKRLDSDTGRTVRSILRPIVPLQLENTRLLHQAGVVLLAATDVGIPMLVPGLSLHEELALLVEAGLTPLEALRTATVNPTRILGIADSLGTIEAGKLADLVILDANPLVDIVNTRRIRAVVADGRLYRRADIDRLLAEVGRN
jgi:imidazolonepropionase-like amidohydrolase